MRRFNLTSRFLVLAASCLAGHSTFAVVAASGQVQSGQTLFTELDPKDTGLDFTNPLLADHPRNYLYPFGYACGGVSIGDLDGDGLPDIFCVGGPEANGLYLQTRSAAGLTFERIEGSDTDGGSAWGTGAALVDIDGDDDLDIYICNYDSPNQLYINRSTPGLPNFTEEAAAYGLDIRDASVMSTFADIDNDGDLDVYLACNRYVPPNGLPMEAPGRYIAETQTVEMFPKYERYFRAWRKPDGNFEADSYGREDYLLINEGPNAEGRTTFRDVTDTAGIDGLGHALSATWIDVDEDGLLDLHVANDFEDPDRFYRNLGPGPDGTVRFRDEIAEILPYTSWSSMGADLADLDGDGLLDLLVADMSATTHVKSKVNMGEMGGRQRDTLENGWPRQAMRNMLYLNTGRGVFREAAFLAGLSSSDWTWAVKMADFDQDGRPDVFLTNGMSRNYTDSDVPFSGRQRYGKTQWDHFRIQPALEEQNLAFRNAGDLAFVDASNDWGLAKNGMSYSSAYGDLDLDGDLDLVVANLDDTVSVHRNETDGNWLNIRLRGRGANRHGVGAVVKVVTESHGILARMANPWTGWASTNDRDLHFGLGEDQGVKAIEVTWPGNRVQRLGPADANQVLVIEEPERFDAPSEKTAPTYVDADLATGPGFVHRENAFDDFRNQPLLPGKLSANGPCMAWGDANGDGLADVYFGGAAAQAGELWINVGDGGFTRLEVPAFDGDRMSEDSGAVWFDVERDGDLDLLVLSGSTEYLQGNERLRNRLYLNQGTAAGGMPGFARAGDDVLGNRAFSSGVVIAEDYDQDGDVDLFIGSRSIPAYYPITPESQLLVNDSRDGVVRFLEVTDLVAPGLRAAGLVTGAAWVDVDGDGWKDLAVSTEWGPVKLWRNQRARFTEITEPSGLGAIKGWWNGVEPVDVDGDGDMDLVSLNVGHNTKYGQATCDNPAVLYYGDMDGSGRSHLVEAKIKKKSLLPVRGRSCSSSAMPFIRKDFNTFRDFAEADLSGIYSSERLAKAMRFEADGFETGIWINRSEGDAIRFEFMPLPTIAQLSPAYGVAADDVNGDGVVDLFLAQNHDHREPETGLWRGGVGQLLYGKGDGTFVPVPALESGILLRGDATTVEAIDVDGDGDRDLVATQNNDRVRIFLKRNSEP